MLVVLPTHQNDVIQLQELLRWIKKLGPLKNHRALIVADAATAFTDAINVKTLADDIFAGSHLITNEQPVTGWPDGCYSLFTTALKNVAEPFLVLEPDAIPLRTGWLDLIEEEYRRSDKPFMGYVYDCTQPNLPSKLMSGIAVYPPNAIDYLPIQEKPVHWDVAGAHAMVANGAHTTLIYHLFGEMNLPPTFVPRKTPTSPRNSFTLEDIPAECVLFHRCKNSSLIRLLDRKLFPADHHKELTVCFPVHQGDVGLAVRHAHWLKMLNRKWPNRAIICHDPSCPVVLLNQFEQLLRCSFENVESFVYPRPGIPGYPAAANWMFQNIALHMQELNSPWFLLEADAVVLDRDWLEKLQTEYNQCGLDWMGPHVKGMQHANGSMIYPADAAARMPIAMSCIDQAWDYFGALDYMPLCHDASSLLQHCWTIMNGEACEVGGGELPQHVTPELARKWIRPGVVIFHRFKSTALVDMLITGTWRP